jgi:hypothetical protein
MKLGQECFIVRDANGQALGYFYFDEEQQSPTIDRRLTHDDARRMAVKRRDAIEAAEAKVVQILPPNKRALPPATDQALPAPATDQNPL